MINISKLFNKQRDLDARILEKHPELKGQNNIGWKLLALQVELGECANEWRGFKKWSNDQEPRIHKLIKVDENSTRETNPLLEEYVDCLHFILSIGLELNLTGYKAVFSRVVFSFGEDETIKQFGEVFRYASTFGNYSNDEKYVWYHALFSNFLGLSKSLGFTWEQIEEAYYAKNKVNHERQENNY